MALRIFALLFTFLPISGFGKTLDQELSGRAAMIFVPSKMPPSENRALVVVLHGGLGNATNIVTGRAESPLNLNALAESAGFMVAYLNGTPATRVFGNDKLAWNAGKCCGLPAQKSTDDVSYISHAVSELVKKYEINPKRVYGIGHSNGAMMTERMICETNVYAAAVAISGPLMTENEKCPGARGKRILAIHGASDKNVPVQGGQGTQGLSRAVYVSETHAQEVMTRAGGKYELQIVPNADHVLSNIDKMIQKTEGLTIGAKAVRFFNFLSDDHRATTK